MTAVVLVAPVPALAAALRNATADLDRVEVSERSIIDIDADAVVSPANSFGFMDGGIDRVYVDWFGAVVQDRVREAILMRHQGELMVGHALIVETGLARPRWLIAAPTMRVPMRLPPDTVAPYLAMRAVMLLIREGRIADGPLADTRIADHVGRVAVPGLGTGVGGVPFAIAARQVRAAIRRHRDTPHRPPQSWSEASAEHQSLYTDAFRDLQ